MELAQKLRHDEMSRYNLDDEKDTVDINPDAGNFLLKLFYLKLLLEILRTIIGASLQAPCKRDRPKSPAAPQVKKLKAMLLPKFIRNL